MSMVSSSSGNKGGALENDLENTNLHHPPEHVEGHGRDTDGQHNDTPATLEFVSILRPNRRLPDAKDGPATESPHGTPQVILNQDGTDMAEDVPRWPKLPKLLGGSRRSGKNSSSKTASVWSQFLRRILVRLPNGSTATDDSTASYLSLSNPTSSSFPQPLHSDSPRTAVPRPRPDDGYTSGDAVVGGSQMRIIEYPSAINLECSDADHHPTPEASESQVAGKQSAFRPKQKTNITVHNQFYGGMGGTGGSGIQGRGGDGGVGEGPTVNYHMNAGANVHHIQRQGETADAAVHNSAENYYQPKCHPETRAKMLEDLWEWSLGSDPNHRILWFYGPAGAGKSSVARSFCQKLEKERRLGASFFFQRGHPSRGDGHKLFPTIAYQLCLAAPGFKQVTSQILEDDPSVTNHSLSIQLQKLIIEPCQQSFPNPSLVIVIDGLDECEDKNVQAEIIRSFGMHQKPVPLLFFIASRPEAHLREIFISSLQGIHRPVNIEQSFHDVQKYLQNEFARIHQDHRETMATIPLPWPTPAIVDKLVEKSSGYFIYASTVIRFIDDKDFRPTERLQVITGIKESLPDSGSPFAALDALYIQILSAVPRQPHLLEILAVIAAKISLELRYIDQLLELETGEVQLALRGLRSVIEEAGQNILKGISTLLDVPTGGGKTLAFWYALFYHWEPGNIEKDCQKIVLVVGPLVVLMEEQAKGLNAKGIPTIAITGNSPNLEQSLMDLDQNKYRVVLNQVEFTKNIICLVIDELHCVWEWGNDDFHPEYRQIVQLQLLACLPTGLSILGASATAPYHVIKDILANLGLLADCTHVEVSNEKLNVFLSVRILQHEPESFADLFVLFPDEAEGPEDFLQTLIYANGRQEVEKNQEFLRDNAPPSIDPKKAFEFYHRHIDDDQKEKIQNHIKSGELRGVSATDALGLGMDFQTIMRVLLWMKPRSFLSLVQKIGCCMWDWRLRGEAVLYITKAMYTRCCAELEILKTEKEAAEQEDSAAGSDEEENPEEPPDREHALALQDTLDEEEEAVAAPVKRWRKGKGKPKILSPMEERNQQYFLEYITTTKCRRLVWNKYFGNQSKKRLNLPVPEGPCCDNCNPEAFKVPTIALVGECKLKTGRKGLSSPELESAVRKKLEAVREQIVASKYPNQHFLTSNAIVADDVLDTLAKRARLVTSIETLQQQT
ncbi:p-loop containing nucleoside triphosphate hydrolase protein [Mycena venus]|uniref:DNA 3'-5' helicase n=1 Tax=Mycena venus TaxID=2733690 RepID=A0A8H6YY20_9AGAR|nr:p-loop containing nucleoside triphosphate hydrolase protein [Mycena venus]